MPTRRRRWRRAEQEIARRGLVAAVTALFYTSLAADHKLAVAESAQQEAADFTKLTSEREQAREAAHADVVKAQLVEQQRKRDLEDARVAAEKARLELGVLLFADPRTPYTLQAAEAAPPLPSQRRRGAGRGQKQSRTEERAGGAGSEQCRRAGGVGRPAARCGLERDLRHRCATVCRQWPAEHRTWHRWYGTSRATWATRPA